MRRTLSACIATLVVACGSSETGGIDPVPVSESLSFPPGFLFGTAIAGFQVDMGCPSMPASTCDDPNSDWYAFVTSDETTMDANTHLSGQPPSVGPGHWELYEDDVRAAKDELKSTGLRFSLEWSRIFPTSTEGVDGYEALSAIANKDAIAHYHAELAALKQRGLSPLVTLNHYTLPTWIHDGVGCHVDLDGCSPRGWLDKDRTVAEIAKYAGFAAREFGAEIDLWATLNEPFAVVLPGYILPSADRSNPPAVGFRFAEAKTVIVALIEAHARMYDAVKEGDTADADGDGTATRIGVVYAMAPVAPKDPTRAMDVEGAKNLFYLFNMVYLNGVAKGDLDDDLDGKAEHRADLEGRMDYIGINYYTRAHVAGSPSPFLPELSPISTFNALTVEPWEDYPRGIYDMAMLVKEEFGLPSIITENGVADPNDDGTGPSYLVRHLTWLSRAIRDGADVQGYFYWTLIDNYEWNHGMDIRMGLLAVDKDDASKKRTPRRAAATFATIAETGSIPPDLSQAYPAP